LSEAKPIGNFNERVMGIASLNPSYELFRHVFCSPMFNPT